MATLKVLENEVRVQVRNQSDYISLTDIARLKEPNRSDHVIQNWLRNPNTLEFLGIWEQLNNADFNPLEFEGFRKNAGLNSFVLTPRQWNERMLLVFRPKRAATAERMPTRTLPSQFASWISVEFKLYVIKEFQRLKDAEQEQLGWDIKRNLARINYRIHTDAIQENLIPPELTSRQVSLVYASEADVLNMALFGRTAKMWRSANPGAKGNIRDEATIAQLICLSNLENLNALFIKEGVEPSARLSKLNQIAIEQMKRLIEDTSVKKLS